MKVSDITAIYYVAKRQDQYFGFNAQYVIESSNVGIFTPLPATKPELVGAVNLRNQIVPLILPDRWLLTAAKPFEQELPVVFLQVEDIQLAVQFDEVVGVYTSTLSQHIHHPYRHEVPYFKDLITLSDGRVFTTIDTGSLLEEIESLTL